WLKPVESSITGPQRAVLHFQIDTSQWNQSPTGEGKLTFEANSGQKLTMKVTASVQGSPSISRLPPPPAPRSPSPSTIAVEPPPVASSLAVSAPSIENSMSLKFIPAM